MIKKSVVLTLILALNIGLISVQASIIRAVNKQVDNKTLVSIDNSNFVDPTVVPSIFYLNGKIMENIKPIVVNGYPYLPVRSTFNLLNTNVLWAPNNKINVTYNNNIYEFSVDSNIITKNNKQIKNTLNVLKKDSIIYIPARFFSDYLHFDLRYDSPTIQYSGILRFLPVVFLQDNTKDLKDIVFEFPYESSKIIPFSSININKNKTFINTNFPERIPSNIFYETYLNKTTLKDTDSRLFASHVNTTSENINFIIRLENKSKNQATIKLYKDLCTVGNQLYLQDMEQEQLQRFYDLKKQTNPETIILTPNQKTDFLISNIQNREIFSALMDMQIIGEIIATTFIIPTKDARDSLTFETPTVMYDYSYIPKSYQVPKVPQEEINYLTYSGFGDGYEINTNGVLIASELNDKSIGFETGATDTNINEINGLNEIIDINLTEPRGLNNEITKATWVLNLPYVEEHGIFLKNRPRNYGNLGNWNAQYNITTKLINDTTTNKKFTLYFTCEYPANFGFLYNNDFKSKVIDNELYYSPDNRVTSEKYNTVFLHDGMRFWKALEIEVMPNSEKDITYMYTLGTNSSSTVYHLWTSKTP